MAHENETFSVIEGPSKFDLMTSLLVGKTRDSQPSVRFGLQPYGPTAGKSRWPKATHACEAQIMSLKREDGSGECWIVEGHLVIAGESVSFRGYYSTRERTGHFTLVFG